MNLQANSIASYMIHVRLFLIFYALHIPVCINLYVRVNRLYKATVVQQLCTTFIYILLGHIIPRYTNITVLLLGTISIYKQYLIEQPLMQ